MSGTIDILMVTCNRPEYTQRSLTRLLATCDETMRVWLWQNGTDAATLEAIQPALQHPRLFRSHHSPENQLLRAPINWMLEHAQGDYLGFVNDDCLVAEHWAQTLRAAHEREAAFGAIACWHFPEEDFDWSLAEGKIRTFRSGQRLMVHPWVQGSGIMLKRECVEQVGLMPQQDRGFTPYLIRIAAAGRINGWHVPLVLIDHMDDPRSPNTALRTDADLAANPPLSARYREITTIAEWSEHLHNTAAALLEAPSDYRLYVGARKKIRRLLARLNHEQPVY